MDRRVSVRIDADPSAFNRGVLAAEARLRAFSQALNTSSDRGTNLVQTITAIAPAAVPISAAAIPAITGLATQLGFATAAAGVSVLAFQGVGDALKEVNEYAIEPTQENFEAMQEALDKLGPAGQQFVGFLQSIRPEMQGLQDIAQEGLFPGAQEGIEELMELMPEVEDIIREVSTTVGDLMAEAGDNLNDPRWREFFDYLETEARPQLETFGRTLGNTFEGLANMFMAFDPLSDGFSQALLNMSRDFREWSATLAESDGFREFTSYIEENGPRVWDTLGSIANALVQLVEAAAPVGEVALPIISAIADVLAGVAESPLGPTLIATAAGLSAVSRAVALFNAANGGAMSALFRDLRRDGPAAAAGMGKVQAAFTGVEASTARLRTAQDNLAASAIRARDAQFALIPTSEKRAAVRDYVVAQQDVAKAADDVAAAERRRSAAMRQTFATIGKAGAMVGGFALVMSDLDDQMGLTNTASLALLGTMAGPWGTAIGAGIGATLDLAAANNDLESAIEAANQAAEGTDIAAIAEAIRLVRQEAEGFDGLGDIFGLEDSRVAENIAFLEQRIRDLEGGAGGLASVFGSALGPAIGTTAEGFEIAAMAADDFRASLEDVNETLEGRSSLRDYRAALDDFTASVKENGRTLNTHTDAGRRNQEALDNIAVTALKVAEGLKGMNRIEFLQQARKDFVDARMKIGDTRKAARELADDLGLLDRKDPKVEISEKGAKETGRKIDDVRSKAERLADPVTAWLKANDEASGKIQWVDQMLGALDGDTATVRVTTVYGTAGSMYSERVPGGRYDKGGFTPKGGKHEVAGVVHAGEFVADQELTEKYGALFAFLHSGGDLPGFASGGMVGPKYTLDQTRDILNLEQQIRQLQRDLAKTGKEALRGLEITIAQTELEIAARDLRKARRAPLVEQREGFRESISGLRDARRGFDVDGDMSVGDVRSELADFRRDVKEAGGRWTDRLDRMGDRLLKKARSLRDSERALEDEMEVREGLRDSLEKEKRTLEELQRVMDAFGASVAGNFLSDPFNGGYTVRESVAGGVTPIVPDPSLIAARDQLQAAEARLAGIRGRTDLDPLQRSYLASKAVAEVAELRSQVEMLDRGTSAIGDAAEPVERTVSGMEALRETLERETQAALDFAAALGTLRDNGLDATGPFGGLFASLAQSGDLGTAKELAQLTPKELDEFEKMFALREDAAAELAAYTVQEVYTEQFQAQQKALADVRDSIEDSVAEIKRLKGVVGDKVDGLQDINRQGFQWVGNQISGLQDRMSSLERERETNRQKAGGGKRGGRR